jgi:hypothetical protein
MRYILIFLLLVEVLAAQDIHIRTNIVGYSPEDSKIALIMSNETLSGKVHVIIPGKKGDTYKGKVIPAKGNIWGNFRYQYTFDFSGITAPGVYQIKVEKTLSGEIIINKTVYKSYHEDLIAFMRQQRCGYNPYFDVVCHQGDGRIFYAPAEDSTFYDFTGGWHDAGDQLKYLITSSNATARMLLAYELAPEKFDDQFDKMGYPYPNGIPDILDEAKWGLEWILKLHPKPDWLIHQIADDRDHRGFKFPHKDNAEYGWGPNSYRVAYFATGEPQGLGKWKSDATGIANLAGRSAAALAMASRIWDDLKLDKPFSLKCKIAAEELYILGQKKEGFQQGNSYTAPYRYNEDSWADDMEWAAAELYKLTGKSSYLQEAIKYAYLIKDGGWMAQDSMMHYQKYPFMNVGHFALYQNAPDSVRIQLSEWYKSNIKKVITRGESNAFEIGVPFLWCSNNLLVNFITQVMLYEKMTGDTQFHGEMLLHRDWLFGRNPWGTTMFTGIPRNGETPYDVHIPPRALLKKTPPGGLVDGPIYKSIHNNLLGLTLVESDEFADFQNDFVVYHDDIGDYSTNEPTMDGTADAILIMALWSN